MVITGFKTVQDIKDTLDAIDKKGWVWCTGIRPHEETSILNGKVLSTYIKYQDKFIWGDSIDEVDSLKEVGGSIDFKDAIKELLKKETKTLTYKTTKTRSDGVVFTIDTIDGETIEQLKEKASKLRSEANKIQGLLRTHSNLKF